MTLQDAARDTAELARDAARVRSWSRMLREQHVKVTRQVAETEDAVAQTLARLASERPADRNRLQAMSTAARTVAARERDRIGARSH